MFRNDRTMPHTLRDLASTSDRRRRQARRQLRPIFEAMEGRIALSTLSDGGTSTLTIALADNEAFGIQSLGSTYDLTLSGTGTFANGGVASTSDFGSFGADNIAINASGVGRYSKIIIDDASTTTTNVDLVDSAANSYAASLDVEMNKSGSPAAVQIRSTSFSGSAGLTVNTIGGIQLLSGGITTASGPVVLNGNENGNYSAGGLIAVEVEAPITTTSGAITLTGNGGNATDNSDVGVRLVNGGKATTASGPIAITGRVQPGSGGDGVSTFNTGDSLATGASSATGNVTITGDGAGRGRRRGDRRRCEGQLDGGRGQCGDDHRHGLVVRERWRLLRDDGHQRHHGRRQRHHQRHDRQLRRGKCGSLFDQRGRFRLDGDRLDQPPGDRDGRVVRPGHGDRLRHDRQLDRDRGCDALG